jgi:anaphase-promoting complex subunit 3
MFDSQGSEAPPDSSGEKPCKLYKVSEASEKDSLSSSDIHSSPFGSAAPAEPKYSNHKDKGNTETTGEEASINHGKGNDNSNHANASSSVEEAVRSVLGLVGRAYLFLSLHQGEGALAALHALPPKHFMTGSAQHLVGRAHFEKAQYSAAKSALETMQKLDPYRMQGLELLSTCLWQLNQQVELCYLAQKVTAFTEGRTSPEAWCVVGNCLSLQKEHESALKTFQRALAVDPTFTYAYTLSGYEYVANEDFEKGVALFRQAIATNPRHFNAWYGLGSVYLRQEKYALAEYHFAKALSINPQNPVLYCQLGNVLHKTHKFEAALEMLATAARLAPSNPQVRYTRAEVIESMAAAASDPQEQRRYNSEALAELCLVFRMVPREAQVAFRIGVVCKRLGRASDALRYFTLAYDLDPKDNNQIKAALERLDQPDLEEDSF